MAVASQKITLQWKKEGGAKTGEARGAQGGARLEQDCTARRRHQPQTHLQRRRTKARDARARVDATSGGQTTPKRGHVARADVPNQVFGADARRFDGGTHDGGARDEDAPAERNVHATGGSAYERRR
jgi:hypothetical protein